MTLIADFKNIDNAIYEGNLEGLSYQPNKIKIKLFCSRFFLLLLNVLY